MSNVIKSLSQDNSEVVDNANKFELEASKQILLVDSGFIGALLFLISNGNVANAKILVTVAITMLMISLITSVFHIVANHVFFRETSDRISDIINSLGKIKDDSGDKLAIEMIKKLNDSSVVCKSLFYIEIVFFTFGIIFISIISIYNIWH